MPLTVLRVLRRLRVHWESSGLYSLWLLSVAEVALDGQRVLRRELASKAVEKVNTGKHRLVPSIIVCEVNADPDTVAHTLDAAIST